MGLSLRRNKGNRKGPNKKNKQRSYEFRPALAPPTHGVQQSSTQRNGPKTYILDPSNPVPYFRNFSSDEESIVIAKSWDAEAAYAPAETILQNRTVDSDGCTKQIIVSRLNESGLYAAEQHVDTRDEVVFHRVNQVNDPQRDIRTHQVNDMHFQTTDAHQTGSQKQGDISDDDSGLIEGDDEELHFLGMRNGSRRPTGIFHIVQNIFGHGRRTSKTDITEDTQLDTSFYGYDSDSEHSPPHGVTAVEFEHGSLENTSTISESSTDCSASSSSSEEDDSDDEDNLFGADSDSQDWDELMLNCLSCGRQS